MSVGDVNSNEKGSGARFNDGKVPLHFIPVNLWAEYWGVKHRGDGAPAIIDGLSEWQRRALPASEVLKMVPVEWFHEAARVFEFGSKKYASWNWAKGMVWSIPLGCILRHFEAIFQGELDDPESGLQHAGHIVCNLIMLVHYEDFYREGDNRPEANIFHRSIPTGTHDDQADALHYAGQLGAFTSEVER